MTVPTNVNGDDIVAWLGACAGDTGDGHGSKIWRSGTAWHIAIRDLTPPGAPSVHVVFQRFASSPSTGILWHAMEISRERFNSSGKPRGSFVFLSSDEDVIGRCANVSSASHTPRASECVTIHATVVDARMTTSRVCRLLWAIKEACFKKGVTKTGVNQAVQGELAHWPTEPRARFPALARMARGARGPVRSISDTCVSLAADYTRVCVVDADTMMRIISHYERNIWTAYDSYSPLVREGVARVGDAKKVVLVAQSGRSYMACQSWTHRGVMRDFYAFSGCEAMRVLMMSYMIHDGCVHDRDDHLLVEDAPMLDDLGMEMQAKVRYDEAVATIHRFACKDAFVKAVKALVWRPGGRLVERMVAADVGCR